jgi:hypothetical protein
MERDLGSLTRFLGADNWVLQSSKCLLSSYSIHTAAERTHTNWIRSFTLRNTDVV